MKVGVIGAGYVGLVTGACLADNGHEVCCLDVDQSKVAQVESGKAPFHEEGLDEIIGRNIGQRLTASTDLRRVLADADVVLVCVGTPFRDGAIDLRYVVSVAELLGEVVRERSDFPVLTIKSTVTPGTTTGVFRETIERVSGKTAGLDFGLGMNPEFMAEGRAVADFVHPDRIVVGAVDPTSAERLKQLYSHFDPGLIVETNPSTAEMIKYASNSLLATLISFSNEIAAQCEATEDVDVADVLSGVHRMQHLNHVDENNRHHKVSATSFLWAGCGFGGSCFPKDLKALVSYAEERKTPARLLKSVVEINESQPYKLLEILDGETPLSQVGKLTILGTAFKPGTDDVRESPTLKLVERLAELGLPVCCHDPIANDNAAQALRDMQVDLSQVEFTSDLDHALNGAEGVLLVTSWPEYQAVPEKLQGLGSTAILVDGRRFLEPGSYARYFGIGR
ncbi:MAG: UDP-glucose/GDP-mannose dehydrogenase family protein [Xanthomonadales bacterium]|nr:UDP-glucose/GDP-mannose dehydrogenase family protein [Xanthomonadales bacterium]